jgi:hypothetical protein
MPQLLRILVVLRLISGIMIAQTPDSLKFKKPLLPSVSTGNDSNLVFRDSKFINSSDSLSDPVLKIDAYVSLYYAYYDDEITNGGFVQFPTMAPRNQQFGLNMGLLNVNYKNQKVRGNLGLHFGDIAQTVWPRDFNMIQEANAGVKLLKGLWLDAGFFRSHVGVESTQPRENITSSMSLVNNYEPYFFAGAKLTYALNRKLSIQLNTFNSFNSFVDNNRDKLMGLSVVYDPTENITITYNFLTGDESPDSSLIDHRRYYNNFYATMKKGKSTFALEANYGVQDNSSLQDNSKQGVVFSGLILFKYQAMQKTAVYARGEYFSDEDKILTGNLNTGKYVWGTTAGVEFKPFKTCALSAEWRLLESEQLIFRQKNYMLNQRHEVILCLDLWF